ncbi:substrate-binding domain-containing protein [Gaetbulibacter aquiaggeris]|uniref:Substrate-binding domain-containing protein n=1 Tax=Gaetbulibacter aquiaggeris TaxID=1735373 RepID=A0ABW7MRA2_9FLAO
MIEINIGGVPEHFNLAWYLTLKNGEYKNEGINLRWKDYPGGTGEMCKALKNKEIDLAVVLTEGIIKDIIEGNAVKIIQTFVQSPLIWGIHVANDSPYKKIEDLKGTKAAISRYGSGSHLMAYINAQNNHWDLKKDLKFKVINNLEGAIEGLSKGAADYFLWEKFTTKPIVDEGVFRCMGHCPTPWPCFVIAAREDFIKSNKKNIQTILNIINKSTAVFKDIPDIDQTIAKRYGQKIEDVQEWLSLTDWSQNVIDEQTISNTQKQLFDLKIISKIVHYEDLIYKL